MIDAAAEFVVGSRRVAPRIALLATMIFGLSALGSPANAQGKLDLSKIPPAAKRAVDFDKDIWPIFEKKCFKCHGPKKQKGKLRLDTEDYALAGGEMGKAFIAGKGTESAMVHFISGLDEDMMMPPSGKPLTKEQIGLIRAWVDQGAKWGTSKLATKVEKIAPLVSKALAGHKEWVTSLDFFPGGKYLATSGGQPLIIRPGTMRLFDPVSGKEIEAHVGDVREIDPTTGKPKGQQKGHSSAIWCVRFSPDGKWLATAGYDKLAKLWSVSSSDKGLSTKEVKTLSGHKNWVTCLEFSKDSKQLVTASEDATIRIWNVADGKPIATLPGHKGMVRAIAFSPDGKSLASASFDKTVRVWDYGKALQGKVTDKEGFVSLTAHKEAVWAVAFSPNGKILASAGADNSVRLWNVSPAGTIEERATLGGHKNWVTGLSFDPSGTRLASSSFDKTVRVWNVLSGTEAGNLAEAKSTVWCVSFSPDGKNIYLGTGSQTGEEETVRIWPVEIKKPRIQAF